MLEAGKVKSGHRESWRSFFAGLPEDAPLTGVVHLEAISGYGVNADSAALTSDVERAGASALALVQGLQDAGSRPAAGLWFITRGAQVVETETVGELSGATLWGFARTVSWEFPDLRTRLMDIDPRGEDWPRRVVDELLYPDQETQVAYRDERRLVARLTQRAGRLELPAGGGWRLRRDPAGSLQDLGTEAVLPSPPGSGEVRIAVEAAGLGIRDVLVGEGVDVELPLGAEFCGRVLEVGSEVSGSVGGRPGGGFRGGDVRSGGGDSGGAGGSGAG